MPNVVQHHGPKAFECIFVRFLSVDLDTNAFVRWNRGPNDLADHLDITAAFPDAIEDQRDGTASGRDGIRLDEEPDGAKISGACIVNTSVTRAQAHGDADFLSLGSSSFELYIRGAGTAFEAFSKFCKEALTHNS